MPTGNSAFFFSFSSVPDLHLHTTLFQTFFFSCSPVPDLLESAVNLRGLEGVGVPQKDACGLLAHHRQDVAVIVPAQAGADPEPPNTGIKLSVCACVCVCVSVCV